MRKAIGFIALLLIGSFLLLGAAYGQERGKGKSPVPAERLRVVRRGKLMELPGGKYRFLGTKVFPWGVLTIEGKRGDRQRLYLLTRDGQRRLIGEGVRIHEPHFSPDGKKVVYSFLEGGRGQICIVDLEAGERVYIRHPAKPVGWISFSPGGDRLVYRVWLDPRNSDIVVAKADGSGRRIIARGKWPKWSPAGDKIAFTRGEYDPVRDRWNSYLWIISPDGKGERKLHSSLDVIGGRIAWSPDGKKIANGPGRSKILISIIDVSTDQRIDVISPFPAAEGSPPVWSPAGNKLAFEVVFFKVGVITFKDAQGREQTKEVTLGDGVVENIDIFVVNSDGSGLRNLTNTPDVEEEDPVWISEDELAVKVGKGRVTEIHILQLGQE